MGRFRYRLQNVLNLKLKMETQAKQEFAAAKAALDREEEALTLLRSRRDDYEREIQRQLAGKLNLREINSLREAVSVMEGFIATQTERVRIAERNLEIARENLEDVMKERKTYETLKDKAFEEFLLDENRQESKEVDELTSYTYGRRRL
jgi:flagellar FliJ protein